MERMYTDLAEWWPLLSPAAEYAEEAANYRQAILEHARGTPKSMLELGSGGGHNAFHLKHSFSMTLVDVSQEMLDQSRRLNPELRHEQGDMRDIRLNEAFDVVFVHDAVSYMTTRHDLERAMATAFAHCAKDGIALFVPDETQETFEPDTTCGGSDLEGRGFRYMEWVWDPDPNDELIVTDYAYLVRELSGDIRVVHDRHNHGLFPRQVWLDTLERVGFSPFSKMCQHSEIPTGQEMFIGIRGTA